MARRIRAAIAGTTGSVGQRFVQLVSNPDCTSTGLTVAHKTLQEPFGEVVLADTLISAHTSRAAVSDERLACVSVELGGRLPWRRSKLACMMTKA